MFAIITSLVKFCAHRARAHSKFVVVCICSSHTVDGVPVYCKRGILLHFSFIFVTTHKPYIRCNNDSKRLNLEVYANGARYKPSMRDFRSG